MMYDVYSVLSGDATIPAKAQTPGLELIRDQGLCAMIAPASPSPVDAVTLNARHARQMHALSIVRAEASLPARLDARLSSRERVVAMLHAHRDELFAQLQGLRGVAQFNLSVQWNLTQAVQRAAQSDDVRALRADLEHRGEVRLEDQARVGELIARGLNDERQRLMDRALHAVEGHLREYGIVPHDNDHTAFNLALLLEHDRATTVRVALDAWAAREVGVSLTLSDALPATAFRLLEITEPRPEDLSRARAVLRLPEHLPVVAAQVRRAFKQLALERHPDRRQDATASDDMRELSWARELLEVASSGVGVRVRRAVTGGVSSPVAAEVA
jgi:Gas vesicle synthesis protein GvpL/GvpF